MNAIHVTVSFDVVRANAEALDFTVLSPETMEACEEAYLLLAAGDLRNHAQVATALRLLLEHYPTFVASYMAVAKTLNEKGFQ